MFYRLLSVLLALAVWAIPLAVDAQGDLPLGAIPREDTFESARSLALGLGNRASSYGTGALAGNVANLPHLPIYDLEAAFGAIPQEKTFGIGGAIIDAKTSQSIAAGIMARGVIGNGERDYNGYDLKLGLAVPIANRLSIGVGGRYLKFNANREDQNGDPIGPDVRGFTLDAAVRVMIVQGLHIAAIGENLVNRESSLVPQRFGGGIAYNFKRMFDVGFDLLADFSTFATTQLLMGSGVEYVLLDKVPLRAGWRGDLGRGVHALTAGVGYDSPKASIAFAMRHEFHTYGQTQLLLSIIGHIP